MGVGQGRQWWELEGEGSSKGQALWLGGRAEGRWATGNDLKKGPGSGAGYLVLKRVSGNLVLLIPTPNGSCVQGSTFPPPALAQPPPWPLSLGEASVLGRGSVGEESRGGRGPAGCLGI